MIDTEAVERTYAEAMEMAEADREPDPVEMLARLFIMREGGRQDLEDRVWGAMREREVGGDHR